MTPETLTCDKCGSIKRIETDDPDYMEKKKSEFLKKYEECKRK